MGLVAGEHHIAQHLGLVAALHVAVVVIDAAGQVVHEQHTLEHRHDVTVAHQRAGHPDFLIHRDAVLAGDCLDFGTDAEAVGQPVEVDLSPSDEL